MAIVKVGGRAGAILSKDSAANKVLLLGYGVYEGDLESPMGFPNPSIRLDSGVQVWGYQCWWGPEDQIKKMTDNCEVQVVDLNGNPSV